MSAKFSYREAEFSPAEIPTDEGTPEQKLFVAIIVRGLQDYHAYKHGKLKPNHYITKAFISQMEIAEWFFNDDFETPEPFTFPWLCMAISDKPQELREKIVKFIQSEEFDLTIRLIHIRRYNRKIVQLLLH